MHSHAIDHQIHGDDLQFVEITLDPGETVIAEAGAMMFMAPEIAMATRMGDGSRPDAGMLDALFSTAKRVLTGCSWTPAASRASRPASTTTSAW